MAAITPLQLFSGYNATATDITIPIASLIGLTAAEADETTGDGREVARAIIETITASYLALPVANRPARMSATKANPQGTGVDQVNQVYGFTFSLSIAQGEADLLAEPA
jgi:hypothetical protein